MSTPHPTPNSDDAAKKREAEELAKKILDDPMLRIAIAERLSGMAVVDGVVQSVLNKTLLKFAVGAAAVTAAGVLLALPTVQEIRTAHETVRASETSIRAAEGEIKQIRSGILESAEQARARLDRAISETADLESRLARERLAQERQLASTRTQLDEFSRRIETLTLTDKRVAEIGDFIKRVDELRQRSGGDLSNLHLASEPPQSIITKQSLVAGTQQPDYQFFSGGLSYSEPKYLQFQDAPKFNIKKSGTLFVQVTGMTQQLDGHVPANTHIGLFDRYGQRVGLNSEKRSNTWDVIKGATGPGGYAPFAATWAFRVTDVDPDYELKVGLTGGGANVNIGLHNTVLSALYLPDPGLPK